MTITVGNIEVPFFYVSQTRKIICKWFYPGKKNYNSTIVYYLFLFLGK